MTSCSRPGFESIYRELNSDHREIEIRHCNVGCELSSVPCSDISQARWVTKSLLKLFTMQDEGVEKNSRFLPRYRPRFLPAWTMALYPDFRRSERKFCTRSGASPGLRAEFHEAVFVGVTELRPPLDCSPPHLRWNKIRAVYLRSTVIGISRDDILLPSTITRP